jgi:NAD(P)-dependent dehydrogenase (short-subunit alcohol dehydrogenase family)
VTGRVVVVTGASGGVGRAVAREFGAKGDRVGLLARGELGLDGAVKDVERAGGWVPDLAQRLPGVRAPSLVLAGELDVADFRRIAERLAREVPGAHRAVVAGAAHLPSLECPAEFDELVLDFLRQNRLVRSPGQSADGQSGSLKISSGTARVPGRHSAGRPAITDSEESPSRTM